MRTFIYIGVALWIGIGIVLFFSILALGALMMNNRLPPKPGESMFRVQPSYLTHDNPAGEYNEAGQRYRKKVTWLQIVAFAYMIASFLLITKDLWAS
ncbi:MAG TPA: hypothetical protein VGL45_04085 [Bradyrhizobium sp.]|jgi:hypothetical protein